MLLVDSDTVFGWIAFCNTGYQELLMVTDKVGSPPGELGVSKSMVCYIFPFSDLTRLGDRKGIRPVKKTAVCWW